MEIEIEEGPYGVEAAINAARLSHIGKKKKRNDMKLLSVLSKRGDDHAKALRGVVLWIRITAPRYWWHEYVTYRIGNEQLGSTSTMHDSMARTERELIEEKSQIPEGREQTRIFMVSYQTLKRMYHARKYHRLPEWRAFCRWIELLPYSNMLITFKEDI